MPSEVAIALRLRGARRFQSEATASAAALRKIGREAKATGERAAMIGRGFSSAGRTMTRYFTLPIVAGLAYGAKKQIEFQDHLTKMTTLLGVSARKMPAVTRELERVSLATGVERGGVANSFFYAKSAGLGFASAMDVARQASRAQVAQLGDAKTTTMLVTSVMKNYADSGMTAAAAVDVMAKSVRLGRIETTRMADATEKSMPFMALLSVSWADLAGSAAQASRFISDPSVIGTGLRQLAATILKPTNAGAKALERMHMTYGSLRKSIAQEGLPRALVDLRAKMDKFGVEATDLFRNVRAANVFLVLTKDGKEYIKTADAAGKSAGLLNQAFLTRIKDPSVRAQMFWNQLQITLSRLGEKAIPIMLKLFKVVGGLLEFMGRHTNLAIAFMAALATAGPLLRIVGMIFHMRAAMLAYRAATLQAAAAQVALADSTAASSAASAAAAQVALADSTAASSAASGGLLARLGRIARFAGPAAIGTAIGMGLSNRYNIAGGSSRMEPGAGISLPGSPSYAFERYLKTHPGATYASWYRRVWLHRRQAGGPMLAGVPYLVGEKGPEIVTSAAPAHVSSNRDVVAAIRELARRPVVVETHLDSGILTRSVARVVDDAKARR